MEEINATRGCYKLFLSTAVCDTITLQNATVELAYVDEVAIATIRCNGSNLFLDHSTERVHVCVGGAWTPSLQDCAGE